MLSLTTAPEALEGRRLLSDRVFDIVREQIIQGTLRPGQRLSVDQIAADLQISRTPVREAMTRLSWSGFTIVEPNARTSVANWDAADMRQRLLLVGRVAALMAADPEPPVVCIADVIRSVDDDVQVFLRLTELFVHRATNRVAAQVSGEQLAPLQLFFQREVLAAHGLNLDRDRARRTDLLAQIHNAADHDDRQAIAQLLTAYAELLASALTRTS